MLFRHFILAFYFLPTFAKRGGYGGGGQRISYPSSTGLSGTNTYQRTHSYPQSGGPHSYPQSGGTHGYPQSTGLSGNSHSNVPRYYQKTEVHHHYNYAPPQYISYGSAHHPVYHGSPPVYVYEYRNSGSRFDSLLTGLALYNLGRMSGNHDHYRNRDYGEYRSRPGEYCKMAISKRNGEYEETRIDCRLMSSFIWDAEREVSTNTISKTVNVTQVITKEGNTTTVQNTTVVDALQVKGPSIQVTQGMDCFMIRISGDYTQLRRKVDCALLQEYARSSLRYSSSENIKIRIILLLLPLLLCFK